MKMSQKMRIPQIIQVMDDKFSSEIYGDLGYPPILGNLCLTSIWDDHSLVEIEWDV